MAAPRARTPPDTPGTKRRAGSPRKRKARRPDASPEDAGTADEDPDAPDAHPATEPAAAPTAADGPPEAPPLADQPFTFLHRGQMHGIDGAIVKSDGSLLVPAAARARVEQMLARGREAEVVLPRREQERQREMDALRQQIDAKHAGIEAWAGLFADLPAIPTRPTRCSSLARSRSSISFRRCSRS
jgi:hypothetical protein